MKRLVVDASVLIEHIVKSAPHRNAAANLFKRASTGEVKLYVSAVTVSETMYVASRVYEIAGVGEPNRESLSYILWVKGRARIVEASEDIAFRAGELRKQLRIALPDCYVIATAEEVEATPLFKGVEKEMKPALTNMEKLNVKFLEGLDDPF